MRRLVGMEKDDKVHMKDHSIVSMPLGNLAVGSPVSAQSVWRMRSWWNVKRVLQALRLTKREPLSLELLDEVQVLKNEALKDKRPVGPTAHMVIGLLQGMQQLASKGRYRMEKEAHVHQHLCEHVRELGLIAGSQNLPLSRFQRWMEERVLLEGLMSGTLGDLSVTFPPDGVNYLRQPMLHMALFEHLCALAWASSAGRNGRISVRALNGEITYQLMVDMADQKHIQGMAKSIWELEKIGVLATSVRGPHTVMDMGIMMITISANE